MADADQAPTVLAATTDDGGEDEHERRLAHAISEASSFIDEPPEAFEAAKSSGIFALNLGGACLLGDVILDEDRRCEANSARVVSHCVCCIVCCIHVQLPLSPSIAYCSCPEQLKGAISPLPQRKKRRCSN